MLIIRADLRVYLFHLAQRLLSLEHLRNGISSGRAKLIARAFLEKIPYLPTLFT